MPNVSPENVRRCPATSVVALASRSADTTVHAPWMLPASCASTPVATTTARRLPIDHGNGAPRILGSLRLPQRLSRQIENPFGHRGQHPPADLRATRRLGLVGVGIEQDVLRTERFERCEIRADLIEG